MAIYWLYSIGSRPTSNLSAYRLPDKGSVEERRISDLLSLDVVCVFISLTSGDGLEQKFGSTHLIQTSMFAAIESHTPNVESPLRDFLTYKVCNSSASYGVVLAALPSSLWEKNLRRNFWLPKINLACYGEIPQTGWHKQNLSFIVLEAGKSKVMRWQIWCLWRIRFLIYRWPSSCCVLIWWKGWGVLWSLL